VRFGDLGRVAILEIKYEAGSKFLHATTRHRVLLKKIASSPEIAQHTERFITDFSTKIVDLANLPKHQLGRDNLTIKRQSRRKTPKTTFLALLSRK